MRNLTHSSRVLNFILPECKPSITEVVRNTLLVEQACSRVKFLAICVKHHHLGPFLDYVRNMPPSVILFLVI